jgi:hypothetical protein
LVVQSQVLLLTLASAVVQQRLRLPLLTLETIGN